MGAISIPILPSRDLDATVAFYGPLGFAVVGRWPGYLVLRHAHGFELHFWHHADEVPEANDVACYVRCDTVAEVEAIHAAWSTVVTGTEGIPRLTPVDPTGPMVETALIDPDGTLVKVGSPAPA
ncbi:MAG TPA: VOC family protein [Iamia sp.]|nr:VOC family protein [Iamia sp.]